MAPLNILICGGGCAGPALAFWLHRGGHTVTVVERYPVVRAAGSQIDLRAQGLEVMRHMGLLDAVRSKRVDEAGLAIVNTANRTQAAFPANTSGQGAQSFTAEYEIMRADLVRILYDATCDDVTYIFGKTVESFEQDEKGVHVHLSDGSSATYDLLVGADGQGSRVRRAILPAHGPDPVHHTGVYFAYWFMPRTEVDENWAKICILPGSRNAATRTHCATESQAILAFFDNSKETQSLSRNSIEQQKEFWAQKFQGTGWQTDRFRETLESTDRFYCQEAVQIKTDTWYKDNVVLLADAAHCPSPLTGMGTTSALVGAWVLAGELTEHSDDIPQALANYERKLRPFVNEIQKLNTRMIRLIYPRTQLGATVLQWLAATVAFLRLPDLLARVTSEKKGNWGLPEYPSLLKV